MSFRLGKGNGWVYAELVMLLFRTYFTGERTSFGPGEPAGDSHMFGDVLPL